MPTRSVLAGAFSLHGWGSTTELPDICKELLRQVFVSTVVNKKIPDPTRLFLVHKKINTKNYWRWKRDCAWGCAWGVNTTWENLQIEKHKTVRWAERTPSWFVLFDLQIFSGGVYSPSATSRTISFSISNSFWYSFDSFFRFFRRERRTMQPEIRSFALLLRSPVNHPIWQCEECVSKSATFLATESVNSAPFKRGETEVHIFGKEKRKTRRQY